MTRGRYASLIIFLPIAVVGIVAVIAVRKIVDVFVLPGEPLDKEIVDDKNWGAAMIEGAVLLGVAFISNMYVPPPGPPYSAEGVPYWDVCD